MFCNIVVHTGLWRIYHATKTVQAWQVTVVVDIIVVVGALIRYLLFYSVRDLRAAQVYEQRSLIQEIML